MGLKIERAPRLRAGYGKKGNPEHLLLLLQVEVVIRQLNGQ